LSPDALPVATGCSAGGAASAAVPAAVPTDAAASDAPACRSTRKPIIKLTNAKLGLQQTLYNCPECRIRSTIALGVLQQQLMTVSSNSCRWSEPSAYHMAGSVMMTRPALVQFWMNSAYPVLPTRIRLQSRKQQQDEQMLEYLNCWDANTRYQKWLQTLSKASAFSLSGERGGW